MDTAIDPATQHVRDEASRRRTFAIISHPDAGKTTLTERFLLLGGAIQEAGAVKARAGRRSATSDWMALEQQRGISITSTVLQFPYRGHTLNLLDTPGHRDFSEDTYRTLTAADAAIMVLDVAKGIEAQTLKLFEVCKARGLPVLTFFNKCDRPGRDPLELLDEVQRKIGLRPTPVTWPVGDPGDFQGVIDRRTHDLVSYERISRGGALAATEEIVPAEDAAKRLGRVWEEAMEGVGLLDAIEANHDQETFLAGETSPLFVGSALTTFGVRMLLDAIVDYAPAPGARPNAEGEQREIDAPFSGFVFKVQAGMDRNHRDRVAFVRVNSGRFERGMVATHEPSGKPFATKYAATVFGNERETVEESYPGDIVGLVNANDVRVGDTLFGGSVPVRFPTIVTFAPELFATARPKDVGRFKQFRKGVAQLAEEGVVQVLRDDRTGDSAPIVAAVGRMQFEVFIWRLENDFGAPSVLEGTPYKVARRTDAESAEAMKNERHVRVLTRHDGVLLAMFETEFWLKRLQDEHPELTLDAIVADRHQ